MHLSSAPGAHAAAKRSRYQTGFSLMELLIASTLMMLAVGLTFRFLNGFTQTSNRAILTSTIEEKYRTALTRLEREMAGAAEVITSVPGNATITTTKNRLVFRVPAYSANGFIVVNSSGVPISDTFVLSVVDDPSAALLHERNPKVRPQMLTLSIFSSPDSTRSSLSGQVLARNLMPKDTTTDNYDCPASESNCPLPTATVNPSLGYGAGSSTFTLLKRDGTVVDPTDTSHFDQISDVKILLRGEQEDGFRVIRASKEFEIRLRNWRPNPTPTPTP